MKKLRNITSIEFFEKLNDEGFSTKRNLQPHLPNFQSHRIKYNGEDEGYSSAMLVRNSNIPKS